MKSLRPLLVASLALLALTTAARAADWTEDYDAAVAQAKKEHKPLLLDFEGSDWCTPCIRLEKEVLDTPKFKAYADKHLVLVSVDFPAKKEQTDKLKIQNLGLQDKFDIHSFPTLLLLSPDGKILFASSGYGPDLTVDALLAQFAK